MPFLVPALVSGISDVLILVVNRHRRVIHSQLLQQLSLSAEDDDEDEQSLLAVHHVQYLAVAAFVRLLLLVFPLPYHSYNGTAIRFYSCYRFFYGLTLALVLLQMVALSMVDPGSLATLLPGGIPSATGNATQLEDGGSSSPSFLFDSMTARIETSEVSRYAWWVLLLSLLAVISHFIRKNLVFPCALALRPWPLRTDGSMPKDWMMSSCLSPSMA